MIYTRIDTYSVILYNVSIRQVLNHFDVPIECLDEVFTNNYKKRDCKIGDTYVWTYNGLRFETKFDEYLDNQDDNISIFDVEFQWLRFYISGDGIDFIENCHSDVEGYCLSVLLSSPDFYFPITENYKITRCDFAFDYVNYDGNEFERLRKVLLNAEFDNELSEAGRLFTGHSSGISFSVRNGREKTIYLGNPSSNRMLRIYDKKYQLQTPEGIWDTTKIPKSIIDNEITIESWHRIELQTRDEFAFRYLISSGGDFRYIMGEIAAFFDVRKRDGKKLAPLHKIFLWTNRTSIIQNANCYKPRKELEIACSWVEHIALRKIIVLIGAMGVDGFAQWINSCISRRANSTIDKRLAFSSKLNTDLLSVIQQEGLKVDSFGNLENLYKNDDGFYYIKLPSREIPLGPYV